MAITRGPISRELELLPDPRQQAAHKARRIVERFAQLRQGDPKGARHLIRKDDLEVEIVEGPDLVDGLVRVVIRASKGGKELPVDNPYFFANPPVLVHDGTFEETTDPVTGRSVRVPNLKEDPEAAFEEAVASAALAVARMRGAVS